MLVPLGLLYGVGSIDANSPRYFTALFLPLLAIYMIFLRFLCFWQKVNVSPPFPLCGPIYPPMTVRLQYRKKPIPL